MGTCTDIRGQRAFKGRDLLISADLSMLKDARDWAAGAAEDFGMTADEACEIRLATSEAVTNAIIHGSRSRGDAVSLKAREDAGALVFEVRDAGADAAPPRPAAGPAALAEGGRGLQLVEMVMDEVELRRGSCGSLLRFVKRRAEAA